MIVIHLLLLLYDYLYISVNDIIIPIGREGPDSNRETVNGRRRLYYIYLASAFILDVIFLDYFFSASTIYIFLDGLWRFLYYIALLSD